MGLCLSIRCNKSNKLCEHNKNSKDCNICDSDLNIDESNETHTLIKTYEV